MEPEVGFKNASHRDWLASPCSLCWGVALKLWGSLGVMDALH